MKTKIAAFMVETGKAAAVCLMLSAIALALFVACFKIGLLSGIHILFYRGIVLTGLVSLAVFLLGAVLAIRGVIPASLALAAAAVSASINLTVLIVLPVTIDRSVSVFLLGYMAHHPREAFSASELETHFINGYLGKYHQMQRRMDEQELSGNVEQTEPARYRISPQGLQFIKTSRAIAWAFDTDPRFVDPGSETEQGNRR